MNEIAGLPYIEAEFDQHGVIQNPGTIHLPSGVTDLLVASHGWSNSAADARQFYHGFFENFVKEGATPRKLGRQFGVLGVLWPSTKLGEPLPNEMFPPAGSLQVAPDSEILEAKLTQMEAIFAEPRQKRLLHEVRTLLPHLEDRASARSEFVQKIRALFDVPPAKSDVLLKNFFDRDGADLLQSLRSDPDDPYYIIAGLNLGGYNAAALDFLKLTSFLEMRARSERIGGQGVAKIIDQLSPWAQRVHLIGHSFGGRVVAAAAAHSTTDKLDSMSLLQTPISLSGFSRSEQGLFRSVIDRHRIKGPILVTYSQNDKTADFAYPIASRVSGDVSSAFGDSSGKFGGLGHYGLQQMEPNEVIQKKLLPVGRDYSFELGKLINLDATEYVKDHGDVTNPEVAQAVHAAVTRESHRFSARPPPPPPSIFKTTSPGGGPPPSPPPNSTRKPEPVLLGFSVPGRSSPGSTFAVRFAAYIDSARAKVEEQLRALGQKDDKIVTDIPPDSAPHWIVGAPITVRLTGDHVQINQAERSFEWNGRHNLVSFGVRINSNITEPTIQLRFQVFLGPVEIAFVPVDVPLTSGAAEVSANFQTRFSPRSVFASYASKDAAAVALILSAFHRLSPAMDIFQDALDLTPGDEFKPRIQDEIAKRERFLLFWSRNAGASQWVLWELEIAGQKPGKDAVTILSVEDPAIAGSPPGFEGQQQRDPYSLAGYAFQKLQEIVGSQPPNKP